MFFGDRLMGSEEVIPYEPPPFCTDSTLLYEEHEIMQHIDISLHGVSISFSFVYNVVYTNKSNIQLKHLSAERFILPHYIIIIKFDILERKTH